MTSQAVVKEGTKKKASTPWQHWEKDINTARRGGGERRHGGAGGGGARLARPPSPHPILLQTRTLSPELGHTTLNVLFYLILHLVELRFDLAELSFDLVELPFEHLSDLALKCSVKECPYRNLADLSVQELVEGIHI